MVERLVLQVVATSAAQETAIGLGCSGWFPLPTAEGPIGYGMSSICCWSSLNLLYYFPYFLADTFGVEGAGLTAGSPVGDFPWVC